MATEVVGAILAGGLARRIGGRRQGAGPGRWRTDPQACDRAPRATGRCDDAQCQWRSNAVWRFRPAALGRSGCGPSGPTGGSAGRPRMGGAGSSAGALRGDGSRRYAVPAAQLGWPAGGGNDGRARRDGGGGFAGGHIRCFLMAGDAGRATAPGHRQGGDLARSTASPRATGWRPLHSRTNRSIRSSTSIRRTTLPKPSGCGSGAIVTRRVLGAGRLQEYGQTTLQVRLVAELTRRGYRVSTVKHAHHLLRHRPRGPRQLSPPRGRCQGGGGEGLALSLGADARAPTARNAKS